MLRNGVSEHGSFYTIQANDLATAPESRCLVWGIGRKVLADLPVLP